MLMVPPVGTLSGLYPQIENDVRFKVLDDALNWCPTPITTLWSREPVGKECLDLQSAYKTYSDGDAANSNGGTAKQGGSEHSWLEWDCPIPAGLPGGGGTQVQRGAAP